MSGNGFLPARILPPAITRMASPIGGQTLFRVDILSAGIVLAGRWSAVPH
ncbi:hypothetical protein ASZ90_008943 [hydrocarbon metagenome]|uniref:Uncharacterized protein n=1 Tax=hydrocarbon metagenome TaxID=938273 RepID=A0A0W8FK67_9ZZZZ|nr:hypothetical protein [Methanomicrobiaceae archaeon]